jgi:hypothetical protein
MAFHPQHKSSMVKENPLKNWWRLCPRRHIWLLAALLWLLIFRGIRTPKSTIDSLISHVSAPIRQGLARLCAHVPFSVAEVLIGLLAAVVLAYGVWTIIQLVRQKRGAFARIYRCLLFYVTLGVTIYGGFCLMWGVHYYTDSFQDQSGIYAKKATVEELTQTTEYFAKQLGQLADAVPRQADGTMKPEISRYLQETGDLYQGIHQTFPFLSADSLRPKLIFCSDLMSRTNFTGFLFPFTGEANINRNMPVCLMPSTIAHEISHQKGIASEQEANFVAIVACMESGKADYAYSGALLAYIHLSNALYREDKAAWQTIRDSLPQTVVADIQYNNQYWQQFKNTVTTKASEKTYNRFLKSYSQTMGTKSYGAVVDLLIVYYKDC